MKDLGKNKLFSLLLSGIALVSLECKNNNHKSSTPIKSQDSTLSMSSNYENIKIKIMESDSVMLIGHEVTQEYLGIQIPGFNINDTSLNIKKWNKKHPPAPLFWVNNKLNRRVIKEQKILNDSSRKTLVKTLLGPEFMDNTDLSKAECDEPRHSLILFNKDEQSFLSFCFTCKTIHTSADILFSESDMDASKWSDLKIFIRSMGLTKILTKYHE